MSDSGPGGAGQVPELRIDAENECAWCGERRLRLTPRAFAVLRHLVEHRDRLVTKDDMLATVWRDTVVSDAAGEASASSARSPAPSLLVHRAPRAMRLKASDGPGPRHRLRPR